VSTVQLLVSVRSVEEALAVTACDVDLIDLKEPRNGALGGLPPATLRAIVAALRHAGCERTLSATIGDVPMHDVESLLARVAAVAACGVDLVKVGIEPRHGEAPRVIDALAASGAAVVPVFLADHGIDFALVQAACALGFPALMLDTGDKRAGSLFDVADEAGLRRFIAMARGAQRMAGLAGSLQTAHIERLRRLAPDYAGFRSAVCAGDRSGTLEAWRVRGLAAQLRASAEAPA
jgi:(5-formylfuran-3-yl)methyl phosphate synthase